VVTAKRLSWAVVCVGLLIGCGGDGSEPVATPPSQPTDAGVAQMDTVAADHVRSALPRRQHSGSARHHCEPILRGSGGRRGWSNQNCRDHPGGSCSCSRRVRI
jgi:hypothetical protein